MGCKCENVREETGQKKRPETNIQPSTVAVSFWTCFDLLCCSPAKLQTDSFSLLCGKLHCPAERIKVPCRGDQQNLICKSKMVSETKNHYFPQEKLLFLQLSLKLQFVVI